MDKTIYGWAIATLVIGVLGAFSGALTPLLVTKPAIQAAGEYGTATSIGASAASNFQKTQEMKIAGDIVGVYRARSAHDAAVVNSVFEEAAKKAKPLPPLQKTTSSKSLALSTAPKGTAATVPTAGHKKRSTMDENHANSVNKSPILYNIRPSTYHSEPKTLQKRGGPPPSAFAYVS
jgi:hypothetical protein